MFRPHESPHESPGSNLPGQANRDLLDHEIPVTDIDVLRKAFGDRAYPVATDRFLGKSKKKYNRPPWISRELAQNFLDGNPGEGRGTLDGVEISSEEISPKGNRRFTVRGPWEFKDPTGLITLHSEKPEEFETAGGNGIGIKQTALILLRDFRVPHFQIDGEGWKVNYRLVSPAATAGLRHNWLVAQYEKSANRGSCAYIIETGDPEIINALNELPNIGAGKRNEFLQDPDFENAKGALKWLPPDNKGKLETGRLFINGQVMDVDGGPESRGWQGLRGATLRLNDIQYTMSIDRPPLNHFEVGLYARKLVETMSSKDLMNQMARSEKIWAGTKEDKENAGVLEVVETIVRSLSWKFKFPGHEERENMHALYEEIERYFIQKNYLARDSELSKKDEEKLIKEGYILCPQFFRQIGMPNALEKVEKESVETPFTNAPDAAGARRARAEAAKKSGVEVGYEYLGDLRPEQFAEIAKERLQPFLVNATTGKDVLQIQLSEHIPTEVHLKIMVAVNSEKGRLINVIRSIVAHGLSHGIFARASVLQGDRMITFGVDRDPEAKETHLFVRDEAGGKEEAKGTLLNLGIEPRFMPLFEDFKFKKGAKEMPKNLLHVPGERIPPFRSKLGRGFAVASLSALMAMGGWFGLKKSVTFSGEDGEKISDTRPEKTSDSRPDRNRKIPDGVRQVGAGNRNRGESSEAKQFSQWERDEHKKALEEANYPSGKTLEDIMQQYNRAKVPPGYRNLTTEEEVPGPVSADMVENFEILREPTEKQLAHLRILRDAIYATTGVKINNKLFIYRGRGAEGINIGGRGIGIHEGVISGGFLEAFGIAVHETAHNARSRADHGPTFQHAMADLFLEAQRRLLLALEKASAGEKLSREDRAILDFAHEWANTQP